MITPHDLRSTTVGLESLPERTLDRVASMAVERRYAENRVLYRAGDVADGLYFVLSGRVRVARETSDRAHLLHFELAGGVLGEIPVLGGGSLPATATAVEPTRCAHLPTASVERLLREEPEFARFALRRLAVRAQSLLKRIDELTATTVTSRLARYLLERAERTAGKDFALGMSQAALASDLGTAREVLVRSLGALVDARAIRRTGRSRFAVDRESVLRTLAAK